MKYLFQVICVRWGNKYGPEIVNHLYRAVVRHSSLPCRFVCVTDAVCDDYAEGIEVRPFPDFALPFDRLTIGCRAKLSIFAPGVLDEDVPAIYLDLDTLVRGDVARLVRQLERKPGLYMLKCHYVQFWRFQRFLAPLLGQRYYFGNSSVMAFLPRHCRRIYDHFNALSAREVGAPTAYMRTDDRFISFCARDRLRVFPRSLAVKFADEYMTPLLAVEAVRRRLPWVKARRAGLVALAFVSNDFKPDRLAKHSHGQVVAYKRRKVRWRYDEYSAYWRDALELTGE